jgi:hypothetical protein
MDFETVTNLIAASAFTTLLLFVLSVCSWRTPLWRFVVVFYILCSAVGMLLWWPFACQGVVQMALAEGAAVGWVVGPILFGAVKVYRARGARQRAGFDVLVPRESSELRTEQRDVRTQKKG